VDLGSAPQRVLNTHSSDRIAHLFADPWPATARTGFPSPIRGEAHSVPTHSGLAMVTAPRMRTATIEANEQSAIGPTQMQSVWCALLQDVELMTQYQDFGFPPPFAADRESTGRSFRKRQAMGPLGSVTLPNSARNKSPGPLGSRRSDDFVPCMHGRCPEGSVSSC
jgi:hypothetical protein